MGDGRKWARIDRTVDADPHWREPMEERYQRFLELSGGIDQ